MVDNLQQQDYESSTYLITRAMKARILRLIKMAKAYSYKLEYALQTRLEYYGHFLSHEYFGRTTIQCHFSKCAERPAKSSAENRLCLFAAYHEKNRIPTSNLNYIESLHECGFQILYIHNGQLSSKAIDALSPFCAQVICRKNIGQDFGAWKDGYNYCLEKQLMINTEWLLLCNDSNYFLGGSQAKAFTSVLKKKLSDADCDLIALNKNYEIWQHFQSYFLCFHCRIFRQEKFDRFWKQYLPLNNRFHAIKNGEIALTRNIIGSASASILFDSPKLYQAIIKHAPAAEDILQYLPKNSLNLLRSNWDDLGKPINKVYLHQILAYLDSHNPGHAYALLWVKFLKSPFLKKDLYRQGVFTLPQIMSMLNDEDIEGGQNILEEILNGYCAGGSNISYLNYPREAYRKGIPHPSIKTLHGYNYKLFNDTIDNPNDNT